MIKQAQHGQAPATADALDDWIPYQLTRTGQQADCRWLSLAGQRFAEPFFSETVLHCKGLPPNGSRFASLSSLDFLIEQAQRITEVVRPRALIFHVSRCGSTLLSQMLGASPHNIVLSEVPLIDALLRASLAGGSSPLVDTSAAIRACIALLGRRRHAREANLFVKLDSWHVYFWRTLRALYPDVPFLLLYRAPHEVMRSHQQRRGMQAVPGLLEPALFGLSASQVTVADADAYMVKVLMYYFSQFAAMAAHDERSLLLNYRQGGGELLQALTAFSGVVVGDGERACMEARGRFHSKYPDQGFTPDEAGETIPAFLAPAQALYEHLEQIRIGRLRADAPDSV
jgi:hypothetical protein